MFVYQIKLKIEKFFSAKNYEKEVQEILDQLMANIHLQDIVGELPVAKQQMVAIARALNNNQNFNFRRTNNCTHQEEINNPLKL